MIDKKCLELMRTKCKKDAKEKHFWERRGIIWYPELMKVGMTWQCTQCDLCAEEDLEYIQDDALVSGDEQ